MVELKKTSRTKKKKRCGVFLWKVLKRYFSNCSIHGVRYLVEDGRHWSERLFWLLCCGLSWWGCFLMVHGVLVDFANQPVATTVDTNYLNMKAELPSIHICFQQSTDTEDFLKRTWGKVGGPLKMTNYITYGYNSRLKEPHDAETFAKFAETLKVRCEEVFEWCMWNEKLLNCCAIFRPLWTPMGRCHSLNSMYTRGSNNIGGIDDANFFVRNRDESGILIVKLHYVSDSKKSFAYILNQVSLPTVTTSTDNKLPTDLKKIDLRVDIKLQPTFNEEGVRSLPIEKRQCRFPEETENYLYYKYYSYDACFIEASLKAMISSCGCVCHLYPRTAQMKVCDQNGLACLMKSTELAAVTNNVSCMADCEENTYEMNKLLKGNDTMGLLHVHLLPGPTLSYRRYVVHSKLDLVVAVGSAIGLFVGASVLSVVELPYWLIIRSFDNDDDDDDDNEEVVPEKRQKD